MSNKDEFNKLNRAGKVYAVISLPLAAVVFFLLMSLSVAYVVCAITGSYTYLVLHIFNILISIAVFAVLMLNLKLVRNFSVLTAFTFFAILVNPVNTLRNLKKSWRYFLKLIKS